MSADSMVGIDLGTTFSALAVINRFGMPEIVLNAEGEPTTPSVILFEGDGSVTVGTLARQSAVALPDRVVEYVKREMGKPASEYVRQFDGKTYTAEQLSGFILRKLKTDAEARLGASIETAVITVPAYFGEAQRAATIRAGELAGLKVRRIVNEPTAAALAYGVQSAGRNQTVLVFDLGGGTFDVTVMRIEGRHIDIEASNGAHMLGGKDWDGEIVKHVAQLFVEEHGIDPQSDAASYQDLQARAVQAKIALSSLPKTTITCGFQGRHLKVELTKEKFEELTARHLEHCMDLTRIVLAEAKLSASAIDTVLLTGGSTRMPKVRQALREFFGKEPDHSVNPDEVVALGAAVQGAMLLREKGLASEPVKKMLGDVTSRDVNAHSLGMVTLKDGVLNNSIIIPKNTPIPTEMRRDDFVTSSNNQPTLDVILTQGEDTDPHYCKLLGAYEFYDLPARPAGATRLEVSYKYNLDGMAEVKARDMETGRELPQRVKDEPVDLDSLLQGSASPVDIVFVIDFTGSMTSLIDGVKSNIYSFADELARHSVPWKLGFVGFGDVTYHEPITVSHLTDSVDEFKGFVAAQPMLGGGDEPESQIDALFAAA